ncbi:hypothetical protein BC941DRAFT_427771 [Chlamydoabsidia padenii]|nr:hypothetical protein BC941DRAFT_427771 [Chlamydoabsidia padenii]
MATTTLDLNQLVDQLSKSFEQCLDSSLSGPAISKEEKASTDIATLKSTIIELEQQLKTIRLQSMKNKNLSLAESISLLKRDIDIKQGTIDKYMGQLDTWMKLLPELQQKSLDVLNAPSTVTVSDSVMGNNSVSSATMETDHQINTTDPDNSHINDITNDEDDDDDDEDIEFEEV